MPDGQSVSHSVSQPVGMVTTRDNAPVQLLRSVSLLGPFPASAAAAAVLQRLCPWAAWVEGVVVEGA